MWSRRRGLFFPEPRAWSQSVRSSRSIPVWCHDRLLFRVYTIARNGLSFSSCRRGSNGTGGFASIIWPCTLLLK
jgi:hypothetical protein